MLSEFYDPDARPAEVVIPPMAGLQRVGQKSKWSCMAASFAMVLSKGQPGQLLYLDIMEQLGRDDERGFHIQEFLGIGVTLGVGFLPFEFNPAVDVAPCRDGEWRDGECQMEKQTSVFGDSDWFPCDSCGGSGAQSAAPLVAWRPEDVMKDHDGVLLGKRKGAKHHHAVAWCHRTQMCLDPEAGIYCIYNFEPEAFWGAFNLAP